MALLLVSPLVVYRAVKQGRYRRGIKQKLFGLSPADLTATGFASSSAPTAWFHAVSVGEMNLLPGVIKSFRQRNPGWRIAVSCSTDTGFDVAQSRFGNSDIQLFFCPLDFTWAVNRTLRTLHPDLLVLVELEVWPNLIRLASAQGCRCTVINARLSEKSGRGYRRLKPLFGHTFARLDWIGCQDHDYAARFIECGAVEHNVKVTGSIKYDDAPLSRETPEVMERSHWAAIEPWHLVWMAGSTHEGEEQYALNSYQQCIKQHPELRLCISPRHNTRFDEVAKLIEANGFKCRRRSQQTTPHTSWEADTVLLVDTIGELKHWWGTAAIALVGGAFGTRGGQNMLEPAGYGCAVCFGPNTANFKDITQRLLDAEGAVQLATPEALTEFVERCLVDRPAAERLGNHARTMISMHRGATSRSIEQLTNLISQAYVIPWQRRAA